MTVNLSYLQFADDTILGCPARYDILLNYIHILDCFGMMSGLIINYDKFAMVPIHCDNSWVNQTKKILGCMPIRYLGIPLVQILIG